MSASAKKIGNVEKNLEGTRVEWNIVDFFSVVEDKGVDYESFPFLFADALWYFHIWYSESIYLYLCTDKPRGYSVQFNFGIRKVDGTVVVLGKGIMKGNDTCDDHDCKSIELSELQQRKAELVPSGVLTVTCKLKRGTADSDQPNTLDKPNFNKLIKLNTLSENFRSLFLNKESCDATLLVVDKEHKAHRTVLMARSPVFAAMFLHETSERQTGIVNIPDCDPESFVEFLEFLYSGKLEEPSPRSALHLYETSDKYNVEELKIFCSEFLMENLTVEHLCDTVIMADKYDDTKLLSAAQSFFNKNLSSVFVTPEWNSFLTKNPRLANKLLIGMSSKVKIAE